MFFDRPTLAGASPLGQSSPGGGGRGRPGARLPPASITAARKLGSPSSTPRILAPASPPGPRKVPPRSGKPPGRRGGAGGCTTSLRGWGAAGPPLPEGQAGRGGSRGRAIPTWPRRGPRNLAAPAPPAGRPPARRAPPRLPAQPRPPPSPGPSPAAAAAACSGGGAAPPQPDRRVGRTKRRRRRRELFSVSAPRSLRRRRRLLTEAGPVAVEKVRARQRQHPRPRPGAGAQRGSTDLCTVPSARPPVPSRLQAGGRGAGARAGGRAGGGARGLPGAVVSPAARRGGSGGPGDGRGGERASSAEPPGVGSVSSVAPGSNPSGLSARRAVAVGGGRWREGAEAGALHLRHGGRGRSGAGGTRLLAAPRACPRSSAHPRLWPALPKVPSTVGEPRLPPAPRGTLGTSGPGGSLVKNQQH
ncbi:collagen alpha-1(I) chain [Mesocricetus auratus]|uniref:Collagen alpha-1(I) chain n=1 Tax=Mesocricetus auratus TaxID=10036 RepID=A0ABM2WE40_MESAU|nr:collagen alpha-1(I) chain [Mesocricetus auratus]